MTMYVPSTFTCIVFQHVVLAISRSKNDNTVVYRARTQNHHFIESEAIEVYWMGFSRKDPHASLDKLRDELSWIEKKIAYGATAHRHGHVGDEYEVKLVAVPSLKTVMKYHGDRVRLTGTLGGRTSYITRVYVMAKENFVGLPTVIFVNIHGIDIETGEEIVEKISH
jgi:hypothetical protein